MTTEACRECMELLRTNIDVMHEAHARITAQHELNVTLSKRVRTLEMGLRGIEGITTDSNAAQIARAILDD